MSGSLPGLQENAAVAAETFCQRYVQPPKRRRRLAGAHTQCNTAPAHRSRSMPAKFYRPRDHEASPLFQVVREHFTEFEGVYPERYQKAYGYWRPVIRASIDKFLKCGDLKEGFARVRCPDCGKELFLAYSCRQRGACPSCDQKRSLMLALRLNAQVFEAVPHRQWVFTIPRRLRVYFRYDRSLLGKLCQAAYGTVCDTFGLEADGAKGVPALVLTPQTQGDLLN
jgi:predicted RNA-binding Zn-ribbon protein involved in translation (DUF1610 family)